MAGAILGTGIVAWLRQRLGSPAPVADAPPRPPIRAAEALVALGGRFVTDPVAAPAGPGECARATLPATGEGALYGVAARVAVSRGGAVVRLLAADGAILDQLYCPARDAEYDLAAFAPPGRAVALIAGFAAPDSAAAILDARALVFSDAALAPARLVPQHDLADGGWPADPYGAPDVEDAAGRLRALVFASLAAPAEVEWLGDLRVLLEPGDEQSRCLMTSGLYEPEGLSAVAGVLKPGGVFVDVGANCGLYTLFAARAVGPGGTVVAFEPSAREFARLDANVALNRFPQIRLRHAAVADQPGEVALRVAEAKFAGHNTLADRFAYDAVGTHAVEMVAAVTLDAALAGLKRIDMIKLDIEGAELRALRGAAATLARTRPVLLLEVYEDALAANGASVAELVGWLDDHGYRLCDIDTQTGAIAPEARLPPGVNRNLLAVPADAPGPPPPPAGLPGWLERYGYRPRGILHAGAHLAEEMDAYLALAPRLIVWIEADPVLAAAVRAAVAMRTGHPTRQIVIEALITDSDGDPTAFFRFSNAGASSSVFRATALLGETWPGLAETGEVLTLASSRLDTALAAHGVAPGQLDVMVLDLQGAELLALRGAGAHLDAARFVEVEVSQAEFYAGGVQAGELVAFLDAAGLRRMSPLHRHGDTVFRRTLTG